MSNYLTHEDQESSQFKIPFDRIEAAIAKDTNDFNELIEILGLDPNKDLAGSNLSQFELEEANLSNANLSYCRLDQANLRKANLSGANLTGANLSNCDLNNANLKGANLTNANFKILFKRSKV